MNPKKIIVLTLATAAAGTAVITATAAGSTAATGSPVRHKAKTAHVTGSAEIRRTYHHDDDIRSFTIHADAAPYSRPLPGQDGGPGLPGSPNDATGTVTVSHSTNVQGKKVTYTAKGTVDSMVTAPGYATVTAIITWVSPGGPPWTGRRLGFSVYDGGKDKPGRSRDRLGYSWEFMNMSKDAKGNWNDETPVGTSMAPAPFAPVTRGGYTVTHADLPPLPQN